MMQPSLKNNLDLVLFTDLDGTLIDHHTYDLQGSRGAVKKLVERGVPLVFCSSKTFAEQVHLQNELHILQPFIFENGSAIAIPVGFFPINSYTATSREGVYDVVVLAHANASALRSVLTLRPYLHGYAGATDAELSEATGLRGKALHRARDRWFTETLLSRLDEAAARELIAFLLPAGFMLSRGGRFYTVQSALVDKGKAVRWMMDVFRKTSSVAPVFAAVGDSFNDLPMLEVVDRPFLVQRPDLSWTLADDMPRLEKIAGVGPTGFSMAVNMLLSN